MKEIQLTKGYTALVDDVDYEWLSQYSWFSTGPHSYAYATRWAPRPEGRILVYMHRMILDAPSAVSVDHIDGNSLNNQRSNLRLATHGENMRNRKRHSNNTSGYTGVYWDASKRKWRAEVRLNGKNKHAGYFSDVEEAAKARDLLARELHGEFARLNFP